jgi:hypothetical protein
MKNRLSIQLNTGISRYLQEGSMRLDAVQCEYRLGCTLNHKYNGQETPQGQACPGVWKLRHIASAGVACLPLLLAAPSCFAAVAAAAFSSAAYEPW